MGRVVISIRTTLAMLALAATCETSSGADWPQYRADSARSGYTSETLPDELSGITNVHINAVEHGDKIVFLHSVKPGPANQSYGLQVAQLAGVPANVIDQARKKLVELEQNSVATHADTGQFEMFNDRPHPVIERLQEMDMDELSPREALDLLYQLKKDSSK